jgi:hypothetical protein
MNGQAMIVGGLSEFKEDQTVQKSLLQRIEEATSDEEIQELLKLGSTYKKASVKTLKMWAKAAAVRSDQIKLK